MVNRTARFLPINLRNLSARLGLGILIVMELSLASGYYIAVVAPEASNSEATKHKKGGMEGEKSKPSDILLYYILYTVK